MITHRFCKLAYKTGMVSPEAGMIAECSDCQDWRGQCSKLMAERDELSTEVRSLRRKLAWANSRRLSAIRFCNLILARYAPVEDWAEFDRMNPWLLDAEAATDETARMPSRPVIKEYRVAQEMPVTDGAEETPGAA